MAKIHNESLLSIFRHKLCNSKRLSPSIINRIVSMHSEIQQIIVDVQIKSKLEWNFASSRC